MKDSKIFDKEYILSFATPINADYVNNSFNYLVQLVDLSLSELTANKPLITNYDYLVVNECATFSETQNSSLDVYLVLKSPQIELNTITIANDKPKVLWKKIKFAWQHRNDYKNKKKKKQRQTSFVNNEKYNVIYFKKDFAKHLASHMQKTSTVTIYSKHLELKGKDELGININIYPAFKNGQKLKIFNAIDYKFIEIDYKNRFLNIKDKNLRTNNLYETALRMFNNLYYHLMNEHINAVLIESLLISCPDELFTKDYYEMFLNLANYISMISLKKLISVTDLKTNILQDKLCACTAMHLSKFIKLLIKTI